MAQIVFDRAYCPVGFLIVRDGADMRDELQSVLIQSDHEYPAVAGDCGFVPPDGLNYTDTISAAIDWLCEHDGESFPQLDEYLSSGSQDGHADIYRRASAMDACRD